MKKLSLIIFLLCSCVQNQGGSYDAFILPNQTYVYDFSNTASFTYNTTFITLDSTGAYLTPLFLEIDKFDDGVDTDWTPFTTSLATISLNETGGRLYFDCTNSWAGVHYNVVPLYTDYMLYAEVTMSSWDLAAKPIGLISRFVNNSNFYIAQTFGNTHYLYKREAGIWLPPLNTAAGFTPVAGVTYAMKLRISGSTAVVIQYKAWDKSGAEPGAWSLTAFENEPPNTTFKNGALALTCFAGDGYWDNIRLYNGASTTNYSTSISTLTFPLVTGVASVEQWSGLNMDITLPVGDVLRFEASADGGATYLTYSGGWVTNVGGFATAMSLSTFQNNITSFPTSSSSLLIRAYFQSATGSTTPQINSASLNYKIVK